MVRPAHLLQLALLAVITVASPHQMLQERDESPAKEKVKSPTKKKVQPKAACFPYEDKTCGKLFLGIPLSKDPSNGDCKCTRPTDRTKIVEGNKVRHAFLDDAKKNGIDWAKLAFHQRYLEVYDEWHRVNSSLAGQTASEVANKAGAAWKWRDELLKSAPEIYGPDRQEFKDSENKGKNSSWVRVPGTSEWVKKTVSRKRLAELPAIVRNVKKAEATAYKWNNATSKTQDEFKPWLEEWLKREENDVAESEKEQAQYEDDVRGRGLCGDRDNSVIFKTTDAARAHMDNGRYVWEIDDFISRLSRDDMSKGGTTRGELPWPEQYAVEYKWTDTNTARDQKFGSCRSMTDTCRIFPTESNDKYSCMWFWKNTDIYNGRVAYWVFRLIEGVNHKINFFSESLTKNTLDTFLKLEAINQDFKTPEKQEDPAWKWFKFAFGMVTNFLPMAPGVSQGGSESLTKGIELFQLVIGQFDAVNEEVKAARDAKKAVPITSAELGTALSDIFSSTSKGLLRDLETALGKSERVKDWETLPEFGNVADLKTPVGKFLNNPLWLVENDADVLNAVMAATAANVQYKMIDMKIRSENWYLTLDTRGNFKCEGKGARTINYAGGDKCFRLYQIAGWDQIKNKPEPADDAFYDKMAKYNLKDDALTKYYEHILNCYQKKGKDGELDENDAVTPGGAAPTCFFSLRVAKVNAGSGCDQGAHGRMYNCRTWSSAELEK